MLFKFLEHLTIALFLVYSFMNGSIIFFLSKMAIFDFFTHEISIRTVQRLREIRERKKILLIN